MARPYIVAHGATDPEGSHSWCLGDQIYMARVTPSPETINDRRAWEYFAGHDSEGKAKWTRNWHDVQPILDWPAHMGVRQKSSQPKQSLLFLPVCD